jgi:uncharacterized membrane protein
VEDEGEQGGEEPVREFLLLGHRGLMCSRCR